MKRKILHRGAIVSLMLSVGLLGSACGSDDDSSGSGGVTSSGGSSGSSGSGGQSGGGGSAGNGGSAGSSGGNGGTSGSVGSGGSAGVSAAYPAGPYGNNVGDVIANLAWEGYVNEKGDAQSDSKPYVDYSTDAMRKSGAKYGLIHISAFL